MSNALWTAAEAAAATGGQTSGDWSVTGVSIDTRTLEPGDLFVALVGDNSDGHAYLEMAFEKGAAAALVAAGSIEKEDRRYLIVEDTLDGLVALGKAARARTAGRIMAVTGSVGKTSTKEALRAIFEKQGRTHASVASYNNHWGVPLTLARMPRDTEWAIFEIGMNHAGEITPLSKMVQPHAAMVTNVEAAHIAHFNSIEEIADAKGEIFVGLIDGGTAVINFDNPHYARLRTHAEKGGAGKIVGFGTKDGADTHLEKQALHATCSCISASICGQPMTYKLGTPGAHVVMNSLGILSLVQAVGGDLAMAGLALADIKAGKGRGARHLVDDGVRKFLLIDESYNANPTSMKAAFAALAGSKVEGTGVRVAVLGDMLELGEDSEALHAGLHEALEAEAIDRVYTCGPHMKSLSKALPPHMRGAHRETSAKLLDAVAENIHDGDAVMVKGSLGSKMGLIVDGLLALDGGQSDIQQVGN